MGNRILLIDKIHEEVIQAARRAICLAAREKVEIDLKELEFWCVHAVVTAFDCEAERREEMNAGVE